MACASRTPGRGRIRCRRGRDKAAGESAEGRQGSAWNPPDGFAPIDLRQRLRPWRDPRGSAPWWVQERGASFAEYKLSIPSSRRETRVPWRGSAGQYRALDANLLPSDPAAGNTYPRDGRIGRRQCGVGGRNSGRSLRQTRVATTAIHPMWTFHWYAFEICASVCNSPTSGSNRRGCPPRPELHRALSGNTITRDSTRSLSAKSCRCVGAGRAKQRAVGIRSLADFASGKIGSDSPA